MGVRRHDRARSVEPKRSASRDPPVRNLAPGAHRRRTRARGRDVQCDRRVQRREAPLVGVKSPGEHMQKFHVGILLVACVTVVAAGTARGDDARDALGAFVKCAEIADPVKRLECFDAATARGKAALAAPPAQAAQPAKEKSLLDWFGFSRSAPVTKPEEFGKPAPEPGPNEVTQISDGVLEFAKTARGKAIFILD